MYDKRSGAGVLELDNGRLMLPLCCHPKFQVKDASGICITSLLTTMQCRAQMWSWLGGVSLEMHATCMSAHASKLAKQAPVGRTGISVR